MSRGRQQFIVFMFGVLISAILMCSIYFIYSKFISNSKLNLLENSKKQKVLVVIRKIEKGEELIQDAFKVEERLVDQTPSNSIVDINFIQGKWAGLCLDPNVVLTDSMILSINNMFKADERLKEYELQGHLVAGTVKTGDFIDVEFVRTNGDTSTVLSKKQVINRLDNKVVMQVTMEERQSINRALADQSQGVGRIEAVLYLDEKQPASQVTYGSVKQISKENLQQGVVAR